MTILAAVLIKCKQFIFEEILITQFDQFKYSAGLLPATLVTDANFRFDFTINVNWCQIS